VSKIEKRQYIDGRVAVRADDEAINKIAAFNLADCEIMIGCTPQRMDPIANLRRKK
jgi:lipoprotein signal peptidase